MVAGVQKDFEMATKQMRHLLQDKVEIPVLFWNSEASGKRKAMEFTGGGRLLKKKKIVGSRKKVQEGEKDVRRRSEVRGLTESSRAGEKYK